MKTQSIFVTGPPGIGKSTCLARIAAACDGAKVDGVISGEIRKEGKRAGFEMTLIANGLTGVLASPEIESQFRFGTPRPSDGLPRLGVTHDFLRDIVCPHLASLQGNVDLIIIDEIGAMQATCAAFRRVVVDLVDSRTPLLASLSLADDEWISALRSSEDIPIIQLTRSNRELLATMLTRYVASWVHGD